MRKAITGRMAAPVPLHTAWHMRPCYGGRIGNRERKAGKGRSLRTCGERLDQLPNLLLLFREDYRGNAGKTFLEAFEIAGAREAFFVVFLSACNLSDLPFRPALT